MFLHWWHKWLYQEDIAFTAVCIQLHIQAIIAEAANRGRTELDAQKTAHLGHQLWVSIATENSDPTHPLLSSPLLSSLTPTASETPQSDRLPQLSPYSPMSLPDVEQVAGQNVYMMQNVRLEADIDQSMRNVARLSDHPR